MSSLRRDTHSMISASHWMENGEVRQCCQYFSLLHFLLYHNLEFVPKNNNLRGLVFYHTLTHEDEVKF